MGHITLMPIAASQGTVRAMSWQHLRDELDRRMHEAGYNQKSLALAAGLHETYVRDILIGRSKRPGGAKLMAIARVLGCSVEDLTGLTEPPRPADSRRLPYNPPIPEALPEARLSTFGGRDLNVLGVAAGSPEGVISLGEATVVEVTVRPPELIGVRDAFGLYVSGDSMVDFGLSHGTIIFIHPHRRPHAGQFAVVVKNDGQAFVKRFSGIRNGAVKLAQSNPPKEISIPLDDVKALYTVVGAAYR